MLCYDVTSFKIAGKKKVFQSFFVFIGKGALQTDHEKMDDSRTKAKWKKKLSVLQIDVFR